MSTAQSSTPLLAASRQWQRLVAHELSQSAKGLAAWSVPTAGMLAMALAMQKSMSARGSAFEQKLAAMPREMLLAFGLDRPNLSDAVGYLAANASLFTIIGALYAALLGAQLATREASQRTGELLLTQPIARSTVLLAKAAAGLACVLGFDLVMLAGGWVAYRSAGVPVTNGAAFVSVFAGAALIHSALFALSMLASLSTTHPRTASSLATGLAFGLYGTSVVSRVSDRLAPLGRLSPFTYADAGAIAANGGLEGRAALLVLFTVVLVAAAQVRFERRDIDA